MVGHQGVGRQNDMVQDGHPTKVGWKSNECQMDVGRKSDGGPTDVGRKSNVRQTEVERAELSYRYYDGKWQRCIAAPSNATLR
jgi:hypothetical protein